MQVSAGNRDALLPERAGSCQGSEILETNPIHDEQRSDSAFESAVGADPSFEPRWLADSINEVGYQKTNEEDSVWIWAMWAGMVATLITLCSVAASKGCGRACVWTQGVDGADGTCSLPSVSESGPCALIVDETDCRDGKADPLLKEPSQVLGVLMMLLAFICSTEGAHNQAMRAFYKYIPALFLCYFLPGLLGTAGVYGTHSNNVLYSSFGTPILLPAILVLLTAACDVPAIVALGPKALTMFFTGTFGVIVGGPFAVAIMGGIWPATVRGDEVWRGLAFVAGEWIGGGSNGNANVLSQSIALDVIWGNIWMMALLIMIGQKERMDRWLQADSRPVDALTRKMAAYQKQMERLSTTPDLVLIFIVFLGALAAGLSSILSRLLADGIGSLNSPVLQKMALDSAAFWQILVASGIGLVLSFTPVRELDGAGMSKIASLFLYLLVTMIGMSLDIAQVADNPGIFLLGFFWIGMVATLLLSVGKLTKAPLFFIAVGSQANIGGVASAPIVAAAFNPALAPVGALLGVLGNIIGTFGGWGCALLCQLAAPSNSD